MSLSGECIIQGGNVSAPGIFLDPCPSSGLLGGALRGALSAVQLFGRLAVLETHTLRYQEHHGDP